MTAEQKLTVNHHAKKVVSDSPGLVDFAIELVNPVLNLPKGQVKFCGKFKLQKICNQCFSSNIFLGYLKDSFGYYILATTCPNGKP